MKTKWSEMNQSEKILYCIGLTFCIAGAVFATIDLCNGWQHADLGWSISFALYLLCETKLCWAKERKLAYFNLGLAVVMLGLSIVNMTL